MLIKKNWTTYPPHLVDVVIECPLGWEFVCVRKPEMDLIDGLETKEHIVAPVGIEAVAPLFIRNNPVLPSES